MSTSATHAANPPAPPFGEQAIPDAGTSARERIFCAAKNLFYRHGIRGVSVDAIAAEAETTKVTLYRVFSSKDELVVQVLEDMSRRFWEWWDTIVAPHAGDPRAQIEALFSDARDCIRCDKHERGCPLTNAAVELEEDHPGRKVINEHKLEINRRLRALCREMGARDPDTLGDALSLLVGGIFAAQLGGGNAAAHQIGAVYSAAKALLDSPQLGVPQQ